MIGRREVFGGVLYNVRRKERYIEIMRSRERVV
jgi:hypothetical protein